MKILVTGGTGFIGKRLIRELAKDYELYCLVRKESVHKLGSNVNAVIGDILELEIPDFKYDAIIHLAANTKFNEKCDENVLGTQNICDYALRNGIKRLYYMSTAFVCGDYSGKFSADDFDVGQGFNNNYEKSKFLAEKIVRSYFDKLDITIFRPGIVIDEINFDEGNGFNLVLKHLKNGVFKEFPGNGTNKAYIVDVNKVLDEIVFNMNENSISKTIMIFDVEMLGDLLKEYSKKFNILEPKFLNVEEFKQKYKDMKPIIDLLPYFESKVQLI